VRGVHEFPEFGSGQAAVDIVRLTTELATIQTLRAIDAGHLEDRSWPEQDFHTMEVVHRPVSLDQFLQAMHAGQSWLAERCIAECRELVAPADQADQIALISRTSFEWINRFAHRNSHLYTDAGARGITDAAVAREETVRTILGGHAVDVDAAASVLGYELARCHHTGVILTQEVTDPARPGALQQLAREVLGSLGATTCLVVPIGHCTVWAWGSDNGSSSGRSGAAGPLGAMPPVAVAIGSPAAGLAGFRRTHHEAEEAARVNALRPGRSPGSTSYDDVSLIALLTAAPTDASEFVRRELGALAADSAHVDDLRTTLLTYLDCQRGLQAAASKLFVARNTVTYRLKRAEELLGHGIDVRQPQVWMALTLVRAMGLPPDRSVADQLPRP
jgi:hypothetical protein